MKPPPPEYVSPWKLTRPMALALDALCAHDTDAAAARSLGYTPDALGRFVRLAKEQLRVNGGFAPGELTRSALVALWSAWRRNPAWTDTLIS